MDWQEESERFEKWRKEQREKNNITPVKLHKMPGWFRWRLKAVTGPYPRGLFDHTELSMLDYRFGGDRVFDHWGTGIDGSMISEPYEYSINETFEQNVKDIAGVLGVQYSFTGPDTSWWYPGRTHRVTFFETPESRTLTQLRKERKIREGW